MELSSDNPAARLLKILQEGRELEKNITCRKAWSILLKVEETDSALLISRLGLVMGLLEEIQRNVESESPEQMNGCKDLIHNVSSAFAQQNLNGQWPHFIDKVHPNSINILQAFASLLGQINNTQLIDNSELSKIRKQVDKLLMKIIDDSSLDKDFKKYISYYLQKIIAAIDEYHICGAKPILEAMECTVGHAYVDEKYKNGLINTFVGEELKDILNFMAVVVTLALGLPEVSTLLLLTFQ